MSTMLSLLDALPRHERVGIGGDQSIDVFGISGEDIGAIIERFPDVFEQLMNLSHKPLKMSPGLMGALIAASQRNPHGEDSLLGNELVEKRARTMAVGAQVKLLLAMGRCTFPDGVGPFLEDYASMSSGAVKAIEIVVEVASKEQGTASPLMPKRSAPPQAPPSGS